MSDPRKPTGAREDSPRAGGSDAPSGEGGDEVGDSSGPVPVRDLMRPAPAREEAHGEPRWEGGERSFQRDGVEWTARPAGAGRYGTGSLGTARLLAVHFYRADAPDRPEREALIAAGAFDSLREGELARLFDRATPIEADDDSRRPTTDKG